MTLNLEDLDGQLVSVITIPQGTCKGCMFDSRSFEQCEPLMHICNPSENGGSGSVIFIKDTPENRLDLVIQRLQRKHHEPE